MDALRNKYLRLVNKSLSPFLRYLYHQIQWNDRLIFIKGQRGVGKTTMLLQYIQREIKDLSTCLYISLDDLYFSANRLSDFVESFVVNGGTHLFIDEVHTYPDWSREIKNIYDFYPDLRIVATGSSAIGLHKGVVDLSRRASVYHLHPLSLREFLSLKKGINTAPIQLDELIHEYQNISIELNRLFKPIPIFNEYVLHGAYPFANTQETLFHDKLRNIIHLIIDSDLPAIEHITFETQYKIKKLLYLIANSVPFKPNISELSKKIGTSRDILLKHLDLLARSGILHLLSQSGSGHSVMQKPEKIYMNNPNLMFALYEQANKGTIRETFFIHQISVLHQVHYPKKGDFIVDNRYVFEIGGPHKSTHQITGINNAYLAIDNLEYGSEQKIPLWLFGFLY